jgi:alpha-beta hydrolase superfamily lysophospholipase
LRDAVQGWRGAGLSADEAAERIAAAPGGDQLAEGVARVRADNLLSMDMGVLEAAIDNTTLADADLDAPVGVPMRVLAGEEETGAAYNARHLERLAASHPDVEVVVVPGASHLIHDETRSRDVYMRELAAFVERYG